MFEGEGVSPSRSLREDKAMFRLRNTSTGTLENRRAQFLEGPGKTTDFGDCATGINTEYSKDSNGAGKRGT